MSFFSRHVSVGHADGLSGLHTHFHSTSWWEVGSVKNAKARHNSATPHTNSRYDHQKAEPPRVCRARLMLTRKFLYKSPRYPYTGTDCCGSASARPPAAHTRGTHTTTKMLAVVAATSLGLPKNPSPNLNNLDAKISPVSVDGEEDYPDNAEGSPSSSSGDDDEDANNSLKAYPAKGGDNVAAITAAFEGEGLLFHPAEVWDPTAFGSARGSRLRTACGECGIQWWSGLEKPSPRETSLGIFRFPLVNVRYT